MRLVRLSLVAVLALVAALVVVRPTSAVAQSGATVTARNQTWNGNLAPDGTATFGFLATWTGTNPVPAVTCTLS